MFGKEPAKTQDVPTTKPSYNSHTKPFYKTDVKYSRGQRIVICNSCGDTSFELLENKKRTNRCSRCGATFK